MDPLTCWAAVGISAVATIYLSLVLGALRSYSLAKFEQLLERAPKRMQQMRALLADEEALIVTLTALHGVFVVLGLVALTGAVIAATLADPTSVELGPWRWVWAAAEAGGLGVVLFVALGHVVPYAVGEHRAEAVLLRCLRSLALLNQVAAPLRWLFGGLVIVTLRVANVREPEKEEEIKDDILSAALAGESEGVLDEQAMDLIENLIEFRELSVAEVMTPRIEIQSVEVSDDLEALLGKALDFEKSRLPVTDGGLDRIVGVLMVKDLLRATREADLDLKTLMRRPYFVPETKSAAELLKELRTKKFHMAIVADEYGGTAGLVTIEDLIEELIGDIDDEHDKPDLPVRRLSEHELDVDAKLHIDELNEEYGTHIPEDEDVETVGGFMALRLGRIPRKGDKIQLSANGNGKSASLVVTEADERRVARVRIKLR